MAFRPGLSACLLLGLVWFDGSLSVRPGFAAEAPPDSSALFPAPSLSWQSEALGLSATR